MTAIEQRHGEQIEQADRDRQHRREAEQRGQSLGCYLLRHLGDANRASELIGGLATGNNAADIGHRALDHEPRPLPAKLEGCERPDRLEVGVVRRWRAGDSEDTDALHVAEAILGLFKRGNRLDPELYAAAVDLEHQRLARAGADDLLHVWEALDRS